MQGEDYHPVRQYDDMMMMMMTKMMTMMMMKLTMMHRVRITTQ